MKKNIVVFILRLLSLLPLSWLRALGSGIGILAYKYGSKRSAARLRDNLLLTGIATIENVEQMAKQAAREWYKTLLESGCIAWVGSGKRCSDFVVEAKGFDEVIRCGANGEAILFLTPHIGNFEIALKHATYNVKREFTVLYKPTKSPWLNNVMLNGRGADNITAVPISRRGILTLVKALKRGELVGMLPDSIASEGDGVWVKFFGNDIFATTLGAKMALTPKVNIFIVGSQRVEKGLSVNYIRYNLPDSGDIQTIVQEVYNVIEQIVLQAPTQYYWSYDRFRVPDHAPKLS